MENEIVTAENPVVETPPKKKRKPYACKICGQVGHNARTCPTRVKEPEPAKEQVAPVPTAEGAFTPDPNAVVVSEQVPQVPPEEKK